MKTITALTYGLIGQYGGRKRPGRFSIFIDTLTKTVYPVPLDVEHVDVAQSILGADAERLKYLVPVHIDMVTDNGIESVDSIIVGECGMEELLSVRHPESELENAARLTVAFVRRGEVPCDCEPKISHKYALR